MKKHAEYSKNLFDKTRRLSKEVEVGDFVYHPSGNSHLSKLDPRYEGPFEVAVATWTSSAQKLGHQ